MDVWLVSMLILLDLLRFSSFKLLVVYVPLKWHDLHVISLAEIPCLNVTKVNPGKRSQMVHLMILNMLLQRTPVSD